MDTTITLDEKHFRAVEEKARQRGTTPQAYVHALIEEDNRTFDEILAPVHKGFEAMSDDDLDALFDRAQNHARSNGQSQ